MARLKSCDGFKKLFKRLLGFILYNTFVNDFSGSNFYLGDSYRRPQTIDDDQFVQIDY